MIVIRAAALLTILSAQALFALDSARVLTQAHLTAWTNESGLPQSTINALIQTRDGYLWMGTEEGLVRFDGLRFVIHDHQNAPALRSPFVTGLYEAPDGTLWIGTYGGGIALMRNGAFESFHPELLGSDRVRQFLTTASGAVFAATAGGGLLRIDGDEVTRFTTRDGLPSDRIWMIADDGAGGLWIATHGGGVVRWRDRNVLERITTHEGLPNDVARTLLFDADGTMWIGTDGGGLAAWRDGKIARVITTKDGLPNDFIRTLLRDRDGNLWVGTDGGLARLRGDRMESMGIVEGLPAAGIRSLVEDREGSIWAGTTGGLARLHDTRVLPFTRREGLPVDTVRAVFEDHAGHIWAGTEGGGLCEMLPGHVQCKTEADGLPHGTVFALTESRSGGLWVGTDGGGLIRFRNGKFEEHIDSKSAGLPNERVRALPEVEHGDVWVTKSAGPAGVTGRKATRIAEFDDRQLRPLLLLPDKSVLVGTDGAGLWRVSSDAKQVVQVATVGRGLESDRVFCLARDSEGGGVWIGTSGGGLARLDLQDNTVQSLTRHDGLYDDVVFQVVDAGSRGDLWLMSNRGVFRIARERVKKALRSKKADLSGIVYGTIDGMPSAECNGAFPSAIAAHDGRIWVATSLGIGVIDPSNRLRNEVPPPVHIEEVLIDGVRSRDAQLRIPSGAQRLEIRYTALSLRSPQLVRFRYMLEGYDRNWVDAGTNRVATYTKLVHGNYTFRVLATNEDGIASTVDARLPFAVEPRWFETWWAQLLAVVFMVLLLAAIIRLRLAALHRRHSELEAIVAERTASLRAERERAEAASKAKSDFLANMSHELRTPLNAVLGFVQLMERRAGRDAVDREHLGIINRSGEHLLGLINEVLSLSKIEAGLAKRTDAPFNLARLMRGLVELFQARARAKGLTLRAEVEPSADVTVSGDEGKLRQIVLNLLGNAIKFTEQGTVILRVWWADGHGVIEVQDSGPGIAEGEIQELFQAFAQTESGRRANEGTGLGLAISRGLARIHGGDVVIRSRPGEGTTVRVDVELPAATTDLVRERQRRFGRVIGVPEGTKRPRVLVVDDSPENRQLLVELLRSAACDVLEASDGNEGVARWREHQPDLVFMDLRMEGLGGFDAIRKIRGEQSGFVPRIVVLSASAFDHERMEAMAHGADAFLAKPYREDAVFAQIENLLGMRFLREGVPPVQQTVSSMDALRPEAVQSLPEELRIRLKAAAAGGESDVLQELAQEAARYDAGVSEELAMLARAYRFDEIEAALAAARKEKSA